MNLSIYFGKIFILKFRFSEKATWGRLHTIFASFSGYINFNCSCQFFISGSSVYCWNAIWAWFLIKLLCIGILLHSGLISAQQFWLSARFLLSKNEITSEYCLNISKIVLASTLECSKQFYYEATKNQAKTKFVSRNLFTGNFVAFEGDMFY